MIKKIVTAFVKYPFYAKMVIAFLLIAGTLGFMSMKKSFFPERSERNINISVAYPGASPKEMEEGITTRIENAVRSIVGIKEINSTSGENYSSINIETTGEYDIDETLLEVKNAVDSIASFPVDAEKPVVSKQRSITWAMRLGLSGDVDMLTLKKYASEIEDDFLNSGVISQVQITGYPDLEISVEVTEATLLRYNLTFSDIQQAIATNNIDISAGEIKSDEEEILIRSRARSVNPNIIGDIILRANSDGSFLRIRDVAVVKTKFADVSIRTRMNGQRAVFFTVNKLPTEDLGEISNWIKDYVDEFNAKNSGVKISITYDFLKMLNSRLELLYRNGSVGLILVIASLGLFLSFRLAMWVAWGIPASFLAMFVIASMSGITINMISLFGMILVIGILVDDGIVIAENIYTHFEGGKSPKRAAIDGTMEVLPAVMTSVTTTIVAFSPLFFLEGRMEFMYEMAFVVVVSLGFSLIEAFFVLPAHVGNEHVLRPDKRERKGNTIRGKLILGINFLRYKVYGRLLKQIIEWRWVAVTIPVGLILIIFGLVGGGIIKSTFFPTIPFDAIEINLAFSPGSGEKRTEEYLDKFDRIIWEVNDELVEEFEQDIPFVNFTFPTLGFAFNGQERGAHAGQIFVLLRDMEGSPISSFVIRDRIKKKIGPVPAAEKFTVGGRNRWGSPVSISLLGKDLDQLRGARDYLQKRLQEMPGLQNITNNNPMGKREVRLKLKPEAYFLGLSQREITNQVRAGFFGGQAQRLQEGKDELRVWVRYPKKDRINIGQLESMKIKTRSGEYPLTELADYKIERGPVSIQRYNGQREIRVDADLTDPYAPVPPILQAIEKNIMPDLRKNYHGVDVLYQGQQKDSREAGREISYFFAIAFSLIIVLLMVHFKSASQTVIILMMIPLGWIGAAFGHGIEAIPISMLSAWGMVALSGVIINDSVVFLSKYNSLLLEGKKVKDAVWEAGVARFRAIMLTSLTTVLGLYPIILEKSFQAQFLKPMAVSLAYGVFIGTMFILLFFPALIMVLNDIKLKWNSYLEGKKLKREDVETALINDKITID